MALEQTTILLDTIRRLLRRDASRHLHKIVNKTHGADLAAVFRFLTPKEQVVIFDLMDSIEQRATFFSELEEEAFLNLIANTPAERIAQILEQMPNDDVARLLGKLPNEQAQGLLDLMKKEDSEGVEELLGYDAETAGSVMVPDFVALKEDDTAREAIEALQKEYVDVEMPFYLYVTDGYDRLAGVISLRQLVVVPPETKLKSIMATDVVSVRTSTDQEEVAKLVARYNVLALPVVDENNALVGIVTVDDVIDIMRHEATEDILKMAGAGEGLVESQSIMKSTRIRLPWLLASWLGGVAAFFIIGYFESSLSKLVYLAAFIPVIMGMGGNIGTQSSTIVVRGLATGQLDVKQMWRVVSKELTIGFVLGFVYGALLGLVAHVRYDLWLLGITVGLAVISSMTIAAMVGSLVPMAFARINIDPAVATGPFVTTSIDIVSVFVYFQIATILLI